MIRKSMLIFILAVSVSGCLFAGKHLFSALSEYRQSNAIYKDISSLVRSSMTEPVGTDENPIEAEPTVLPPNGAGNVRTAEQRSPIDFDRLLGINPDVRGWIRLTGTKVDYPVMQSPDNDFYLSHAVTGVWNKSGTPFIDFRNSGDFSDRLTVIYGHFMGDGSMFTDIHKYKTQQFYDEHPAIDLYTPAGQYRLLPIAGVYQNAEYWDFTFDYASDEDFMRQIDQWKAVSTFTADTEYAAGDRFVALTLCTYDIENSRYILIGKLAA